MGTTDNPNGAIKTNKCQAISQATAKSHKKNDDKSYSPSTSCMVKMPLRVLMYSAANTAPVAKPVRL
jgi:hypothetical protein